MDARYNGMAWKKLLIVMTVRGRQTSNMVDFKTQMFSSSNNNYVLLGTDQAAYTPLRLTSFASGREADRFTARLDIPKSYLCASVDFLISRRLLSSYSCQVVRFHFPVT